MDFTLLPLRLVECDLLTSLGSGGELCSSSCVFHELGRGGVRVTCVEVKYCQSVSSTFCPYFCCESAWGFGQKGIRCTLRRKSHTCCSTRTVRFWTSEDWHGLVFFFLRTEGSEVSNKIDHDSVRQTTLARVHFTADRARVFAWQQNSRSIHSRHAVIPDTNSAPTSD